MKVLRNEKYDGLRSYAHRTYGDWADYHSYHYDPSEEGSAEDDRLFDRHQTALSILINFCERFKLPIAFCAVAAIVLALITWG